MNGSNPTSVSYQSDSLTFVARSNASPVNVFLSSSLYDLHKYRDVALTALVKKAKVNCSPCEHWTEGHENIPQLCREKIDHSDGYVGIFGYYYGTVLKGRRESVTHFEYKCANKKWGGGERKRIFILMPRERSKAQKELKKLAFNHLTKVVDENEHDERLNSFHDEVKGRNVIHFDDINDFGMTLVTIGLRLNAIGPTGAARGEIEVVENIQKRRTVTREELGLLGRERQLGSLEKTINCLPAFPDVPAVAFLVSGEEKDGPTEFLYQVAKKKLWRPVTPGRPQVEQYDLESLISWVADSLGFRDEGKTANNIKELAELIHGELRRQQLCVILDEVQRYTGRVPGFYETFWTPLREELEKLQALNRAENRLIMILADSTGLSDRWSAVTATYSDEEIVRSDYSKLFLLKLSDITGPDLLNWFAKVEIPDDGANRIYLMNIAIKDSNGVTDGTPRNVFARLRKQDLWNE